MFGSFKSIGRRLLVPFDSQYEVLGSTPPLPPMVISLTSEGGPLSKMQTLHYSLLKDMDLNSVGLIDEVPFGSVQPYGSFSPSRLGLVGPPGSAHTASPKGLSLTSNTNASRPVPTACFMWSTPVVISYSKFPSPLSSRRQLVSAGVGGGATQELTFLFLCIPPLITARKKTTQAALWQGLSVAIATTHNADSI